MPVPRTRTVNGYAHQVGRILTPYGSYTCNAYPGKYWTCTDVTDGFDTENNFVSDKRLRRGPVMNGTVYFGGTWTRKVSNVIPEVIGNWSVADPRIPFAYPNFTSEVPMWIARMQPGQPKANLPAILGEAREIPSLITQLPEMLLHWGKMRFGKNAGRAARAAQVAREAAKSLGNTNLWYRFGLSPTVADALAMLGLLDSFLKAYEDLLKLARGGTLKRSLRLSPGRIMYDDGKTISHSAGILTYHTRIRVYKSVSWVTSRWSPLVAAYYAGASKRDLVARAMRQVTGLTASGLMTAWWELLPWSWFADWFHNVQARLGMLGAMTMLLKLDSLCYCRTCFIDVYWGSFSGPPGITCVGDGYVNRTVKERKPLTASTSESPSLPALNGRQLGILASLVAMRAL